MLSPTLDIEERYAGAVERLATRFLDSGWVVSRGSNGVSEHQGDSLLFTGIGLGVLPCSAKAVEDNLAATIFRNGGWLVRFDPLPDEYKGGREVSLDGALGLYWGIAQRLKHCGAGPWADVVRLHANRVNSLSNYLYPGSAKLTPEFDYVLALLLHQLTGGDLPSHSRLDRLSAEVAAWAAAVKVSKAAGYRIHLGWLALSTAEALGEDVPRDTFCLAAKDTGLVITDQFCGRSGLEDWANAYQINVWEYQLQRAKWEEADGNGLETPGVDFLLGLTQLYDGLITK